MRLLKSQNRQPLTSYMQRFSFVLAFALFMSSCSINEAETKFNIYRKADVEKISLTELPQFFLLKVRNNSLSIATFYITPSEIDFHNNVSIIASVIKPQMKHSEKAIALWEFVSNYRYHCRTNSVDEHLHNPAMLVNSFGCGLCDDANKALVYLFQQAGLQARLVALNGHVVAEAYYDSKWHMFDADGKYYFQKQGESISAVIDLEKDCSILDFPNRKLNWLKKRILKRTVCTVDDNKVYELPELPDSAYSSEILLLPGEEVCFKSMSTTRLHDKLINSIDAQFYSDKGIKTSLLSFAADTIAVFELPYAQNVIEVNALKGFSGKVFYSPDGKRWFFKGEILNGKGRIRFSSNGTKGESSVFKFYLRLISEGTEDCLVEVKSEFLFSDRAFFNNPSKSFKIVPTRTTGKAGLDVNTEVH